MHRFSPSPDYSNRWHRSNKTKQLQQHKYLSKMESLMRFGRDGCLAVLKHFNEWIAQNDADPDVSRNQIAYAKVAKDLWFSSPKHRILQDLWNNRVKNKDPTRGCLRKV